VKKHIHFSLIILFPAFIFAQTNLKGIIMDAENPKTNLGISGATVNWLHTNIGAITNDKGRFTIPYKKEYKKLVVSYIGYITDTITVSNLTPLRHFISSESTLNEITIRSKRDAIQRSLFATANTFTVNNDELLKAACCNLARLNRNSSNTNVRT
jgi:outer membrane receptor for ferrienterochelin and colicins